MTNHLQLFIMICHLETNHNLDQHLYLKMSSDVLLIDGTSTLRDIVHSVTWVLSLDVTII